MRECSFFLFLFLSLLAFGQDDKRFGPAFSGRRVALVIGNKDYDWKPLTNPENDARAVADTLRQVGFQASDIQLVLNANQVELRRTARLFLESVKPGDMAFVYYSGHGVEVHGANYLLPVDLPSNATEDYVEDEAVSAQRLLRDLDQHGAKVRILVLDACRDNPLRASKTTAGGLAAMEGRGSLIVFATEAGRTAADTPGSSNSVFTRYLIDGLKKPGIPLDLAMKGVAKNVARETNEKQVPAIYGLLLEDVILVGATGSISEPVDEEAWRAVQNSTDAAVLEQFVSEYPRSAHVQAAKRMISAMGKPAIVKPPPSQPQPAMSDLSKQAQALSEQKRFADAFALFTQACERGDQYACVSKGWMTVMGSGTAPDGARGKAIIAKACEDGSALGCTNLGNFYQDVEFQPSVAAQFYAKGCDGGDPVGCYALAELYRTGSGVRQDADTSRQLHSKACAVGLQASCRWLERMR